MLFGISEAEGETNYLLRSKVLSDVFEEKLRIHGNTVERMPRVGRKTNKKRLFVVKFLDYAE